MLHNDAFWAEKRRSYLPKNFNIVFKYHLGKNIEGYIDDMVIKTKENSHELDVVETFSNMKLNPLKCAFRVKAGKFIGFMVNQRGIEENPEKIQALLDMKPPVVSTPIWITPFQTHRKHRRLINAVSETFDTQNPLKTLSNPQPNQGRSLPGIKRDNRTFWEFSGNWKSISCPYGPLCCNNY